MSDSSNDRAPARPETQGRQRARCYWEPQDIGSISLHDCRHTYASLVIAAAENAKALQTAS